MNTQAFSRMAGLSLPKDVKPAPIVPVEECEEYRRAMREMAESRLKKAGLVGAYLQADCSEGSAAFARFLQGRGTYFFGLTGRGKTYAAACCVRLAVQDGHRAYMTTAKSLLDAVKAEYDSSEKGAIKRAEAYELLALDDVGMERATDWAKETLTGLIDTRTASGLATVFTSNYSLGELRDLWGGMQGARIASRIAGACERVEMAGRDRRLDG